MYVRCFNCSNLMDPMELNEETRWCKSCMADEGLCWECGGELDTMSRNAAPELGCLACVMARPSEATGYPLRRGGARPGAGRKPKSDAGPKVQWSNRIDPTTVFQIDELVRVYGPYGLTKAQLIEALVAEAYKSMQGGKPHKAFKDALNLNP